MKRSSFIKVATASLVLPPLAMLTNYSPSGSKMCPLWLKGYKQEYEEYPKVAMLNWFRNVKSGLFIHYELNSLLGRGVGSIL